MNLIDDDGANFRRSNVSWIAISLKNRVHHLASRHLRSSDCQQHKKQKHLLLKVRKPTTKPKKRENKKKKKKKKKKNGKRAARLKVRARQDTFRRYETSQVGAKRVQRETNEQKKKTPQKSNRYSTPKRGHCDAFLDQRQHKQNKTTNKNNKQNNNKQHKQQTKQQNTESSNIIATTPHLPL
jgi:hypothetical protein